MIRSFALTTLLLSGPWGARANEPELVATDGGFDLYGVWVSEPQTQPTPTACHQTYGKAARVTPAEHEDGSSFFSCDVESVNGTRQSAALEKALAALRKKSGSERALETTTRRFMKATVCPPGMEGTYDGHLVCTRDYSARQLCPHGLPGTDPDTGAEGTCLLAGQCPRGHQNLAQLTKGAREGCFRCDVGTYFDAVDQAGGIFVLCRERSDTPAAIARAKRRRERCEAGVRTFITERLEFCAGHSKDSQCEPATIVRGCFDGYASPAQGCGASCRVVLNQLTDERPQRPASR